jgi:hypothetical protein
MMRRCVFLLIFVVLVGACRPESILPPTPTPGAVVPDLTPVRTATPLATGVWQFREPRITPNSALLENEDGFALVSDWQISEIEYVYQWWGLAPEPILESQSIRREGDDFIRNDDTPFTNEELQAFRESIVRFYPSQSIIAGNAWTDDYPSHTIQVTGENGEHLLFISTSTGNPGDGPWNLVYNDKLYAQYDGTFGNVLPTVFVSQRGEPGATFFPGEEEANEVHFSTEGLPLQLEYGFDGLLPLAQSFVYRPNLANQTIEGSLVGRSSIGGFGNMVIGTFPSLDSITLATPDPVECTTQSIEMNDAVGAAWSFTCPVPSALAESPYLYPITIVLQNDKGVPVTLEGTLSGVWSTDYRTPRLPIPPYLREVLEADNDASDLLTSHDYALAGYSATLSATSPHELLNLYGDITLYGSTNYEGETIRYQVTTPMSIGENQMLQWELTSEALSHLITDTLNLPETRTLIVNDPDLVLHLGYLAPIEQEFRYMDSYYGAMPPAHPVWCDGESPAEEAPESTLVRAVGYLLNGGNSLLYGGLNEENQLSFSYADLNLGTDFSTVTFPNGTTLDIGYLNLRRSPMWNSLTFGMDPSEATPERIALFEELADHLGGELNYSDSTPEEHPQWWVGEAFSLEITDTGDLRLIACE